MSAMQYSTVQKGWNYFIILYSQQIYIFHPTLLVNNHIHLPRKKSSNEVSIFLPLFACLKILVICGGVTLCIPAADASSIYLYCIQYRIYTLTCTGMHCTIMYRVFIWAVVKLFR